MPASAGIFIFCGFTSQKISAIIPQHRIASLAGFSERKSISYLCVVVAICLKTLLYLHFFQLEGDKLFQAVAAKSFVEGNGFTFRHVSPLDLTTPIIEPVNRWPIGYALLLAPVYWLTGNPGAACIIIDLLSICFFFITLFRLLRLLQLPPFLINVIILLSGAAFGQSISKPTDLLACASLLFACYLFMRFLSDPFKPARYGLIIGVGNVIAPLLRYMYLSSAWVLPAVLLWVGYRKKENRITAAGFYAVATTIILVVAGYVIQKSVVGNAVYMINTEKGFFPQNLLMTYPFIPDAFFDINFVQQQLTLIAGISYLSLYEYLKAANLILLAILVYLFFRYLAHKYAAVITRWDGFLISSGAINIMILLILAYLSLTNSSAPPVPYLPFEWTFIGDGRYFLFTITILQVVAGYYLFNVRWSSGQKYQRAVQSLFLALVFFQLIHTFYFIGKRFDPFGSNGGNVLITNPAKSYIQNRISTARQKGWNIVLTGTDETVSNWASLIGVNGVLRLDDLLSADIRPRKPSMVFVLVEKNVLPSVESKLAGRNFTMEKKIDKLYIFSSYLHTVE